jgi:hypothetical protein
MTSRLLEVDGESLKKNLSDLLRTVVSMSSNYILRRLPRDTILLLGLIGAIVCLSFLWSPTGHNEPETSYSHRWSDGPFFMAIIPLANSVLDIFWYIADEKKATSVHPDEPTKSNEEIKDTTDSHEDHRTIGLLLAERLFFALGLIFMAVPSFKIQEWRNESTSHGPTLLDFSVFSGAGSICCVSAIVNYLYRTGGSPSFISLSTVLFAVVFDLSCVLGTYADTASAAADPRLSLVSSVLILAAAGIFIGECMRSISPFILPYYKCGCGEQQTNGGEAEKEEVRPTTTKDSKDESPDVSDSGLVLSVAISFAIMTILIPLVVDAVRQRIHYGVWSPRDYSPRSYTTVIAAVLVFMADAYIRENSVVQALVRDASYYYL